MNDFVRARQPEQKRQRLDAILAAAGKLFSGNAFADVSMQGIAGEAGLGKASLYHYFSTKEEVFLELLLRDLSEWVDDFADRIGSLPSPTRADVAQVMTRMMLDHSRCSRLLSILASVLERNVNARKLREFKFKLLQPFGRITATLVIAIPELSQEEAGQFVIQFYSTLCGLWSVAHPNEELATALDDPQLDVFRVDFETTFKAILLKLLNA